VKRVTNVFKAQESLIAPYAAEAGLAYDESNQVVARDDFPKQDANDACLM